MDSGMRVFFFYCEEVYESGWKCQSKPDEFDHTCNIFGSAKKELPIRSTFTVSFISKWELPLSSLQASCFPWLINDKVLSVNYSSSF